MYKVIRLGEVHYIEIHDINKNNSLHSSLCCVLLLDIVLKIYVLEFYMKKS